MARPGSETTGESKGMTAYSQEERALACLRGVAVGDAMGKMTEGYWPWEIEAAYGGPIAGFREPIQPRSRFSWSRAEVTDDTRFTLIVAHSIVSRGRVDRQDITERIVVEPIKGWPGWAEFSAGVSANPDYAAHRTGNGAPMRCAPVGIVCGPHDLAALVDAVEEACAMTHGVGPAIAAAASLAAAVSAAVAGWARDELLDLACEAAVLGAQRGRPLRAPSVAESIRIGRRLVAGRDAALGWQLRGLSPGFTAWEGASFALSLVAGTHSAEEAILEATNQGGDADSVASMAGAVLAALDPASLPAGWIAEVESANGLDLAPIARQLVALRSTH